MFIVRALFLYVCLVIPSVAYTQDAHFDVVSIREIPASTTTIYSPGHTMTIGVAYKPCEFHTERVICQLSLFELLRDAYQLDRNELEAPESLKDHVFIFEATMPEGTSQVTARQMLQQALKERFHLSFHREDKLIDVYAMVPAKGGLKLQPAEDAAHRKRIKAPGLVGDRGASMVHSDGRYENIGTTLDFFALHLRQYAGLDRPVINKTGQSGEFKINLHWDPADDSDTSPGGGDPNFRIAVEKQMGIKLEKQKVPMNIFVVDHIDLTPTAN